MSDRPLGKEEPDTLPNYSALEAVPIRNLPPDLRAQENSPDFMARGDQIAQELLDPGRRPSDDQPLFFSLRNERGIVTLTLPEPTGPCLVSFTTPIRAADYVRVQFRSAPKPQYLASSPKQFVKLVGDLRERSKVMQVAVDRCPRCEDILVVATDSIQDTSHALKVWALLKAGQTALCELYGSYAVSEARKDNLAVAREVLLQLVGHVAPDHPGAHLLLGKLAIRLRDEQLLREAAAYLACLRQADRLAELEAAQKSGALHF